MPHHRSTRLIARTASPAPRRRGRLRRTVTAAVSVLLAGVAAVSYPPAAHAALAFEVPRLDGSGNNLANPNWGRAGQPYTRVAPANYTDGRSAPVTGPNARYISNRVMNDEHVNIFSEHRVTGWGWTWGQFLDHTFGVRQDSSEPFNIPFDRADPLESYRNDFGTVQMNRSAAAPGTGTTNARQQVNTESSYLNGAVVYGNTNDRLEWMRTGPVNNNMADNGPTLMMPGGYLPTADARGDAATAPKFDVDGRLRANPAKGYVAGDGRANENLNLAATQTLFAREHNRIVSRLPNTLTSEEKFQIARRIVMAEQQYITYQEFLPSLGVTLPAYTGYKPGVNAALSNEFAAAGYRMHSSIHSETEIETNASRYTRAQLDRFRAEGIIVEPDGDDIALVLPLNTSFFNPTLLPELQLGPMLQSIGNEAQYRNDEQFANALRAVLFQVPVPGNPECVSDVPEQPQCFQGVSDLAAIDIARALDHGLPSYNALRRAYGLAPKTSFTSITGEATDRFPSDPALTPGREIDDPDSLDMVALSDIDGEPIDLADEDAVEGEGTEQVRRTTLAARLRAIYGSVDRIDPFTGIIAEQHLPHSDLGELQTAIWRKQFLALRDGDRFFYGNQVTELNTIAQQYGIDFRRTLKDIIVANSDADPTAMSDNVFLLPDTSLPATSCKITWTKNNQWPSGFGTSISITNTGTEPILGWNLTWQFTNDQRIQTLWAARLTQTGADVSARNETFNSVIAPGATISGIGFNASWDNVANAKPAMFHLNGTRCTG